MSATELSVEPPLPRPPPRAPVPSPRVPPTPRARPSRRRRILAGPACAVAPSPAVPHAALGLRATRWHALGLRATRWHALGLRATCWHGTASASSAQCRVACCSSSPAVTCSPLPHVKRVYFLAFLQIDCHVHVLFLLHGTGFVVLHLICAL